ncbi:MAG: phosphodiester glycosidase family protein [Actinomycetota bacterium]|nr:phosphodiester glycosidase family protein [Actinomycetota bacterium]
MGKRSGTAKIALAAFLTMCTLAVQAGGQMSASGADRFTIHRSRVSPGVRLTKIVDSRGPNRVSVLTVDPSRVPTIDVALARNKLPGNQRTSGMAAQHGAVAAVNGTFGLPGGRPVGLFAEDGELKTSSLTWGRAFAPTHDESNYFFGHPGFSLTATGGTSGTILKVHTWNEGPPAEDEIAGYTTAGKRMIAPPSQACSVRLLPQSKRAWAENQDGFERKMFVDRVRCSDQRMKRLGGIVLATPTWGPLAPKLRSLLLGELVMMRWSFGWPGALDVLPGNPTLMEDGDNAGYWCADPFCGRNPRTGVGLDGEGQILLVTVDGRRPGYSVGMTLLEFARQFERLGARWALNLDGGGSTTMWVKGRVVNRPSDPAGERHVSSALLVLGGQDPGEVEPLSYGSLAFETPTGGPTSTDSSLVAPTPERSVESVLSGQLAADDPGSTGGLLDAIDGGEVEPSAHLSPTLQRIADEFAEGMARP